MGRSYSTDMRERVARAVAAGAKVREAGARFEVSAATAVRWSRLARETGSVAPKRQGRPPGQGKLAAQMAFLVETVEARPDITMPELAAELEGQRGVRADPSSLSRVLRKAGYSYKKTADGQRMRQS